MTTNRRPGAALLLLGFTLCVAWNVRVWAFETDVRLVYVESKTEFVPPQTDGNDFGGICVVSQDGQNVYAVRGIELIIYRRD